MLLPQALERFEVRSRLGAGSFGTVYEAFDRHRNRIVALKVLERVAPDSVARFKREFRTLAELRHPNLASLHELLVLGGQWLLTMELVRGSELLEHLAFVELQQSFVQTRIPTLTGFDGDQTMVVGRRPASRISPTYIRHIRSTFQQLATALAVLHARGVVHRDIKPSNIMIGRDGRVVVLDFGLVIEESMEDTLDRRHVVGTPGYMSPEQIAAGPATAASDWYSFGVLLFQALTGTLPFEGDTAMDVVHQQLNIDAPDPRSLVSDVPEDLAALTVACLQRDAPARPSAGEVLERVGVVGFDPMRIERSRERTADLVGRGRELRTLRTWMNALQAGESRIFLIEGSPGVGKTALLDRFLDVIRAEGETMILAGRCQPWESLPFNAVDGIVDALAREVRRVSSAETDEVLNRAVALTELFPLFTRTTPLSGDDTMEVPRGTTLLRRAAAELRALVHAAAGERTILLVLDDAQWGDYQSASMLLRLLEHANGHRVALVLVYTSEDWRTSLLLQALDLGRVKPRPRRLELHDLSRAMTRKLVGDKRRGDAAYRLSGGNPALIELALDARGILGRLEGLSAAAQQLFAIVRGSDGPTEQSLLEQQLELFEIDEPLRSLVAERLVRLRRTGNLSEVDLYHPRLRDL
jgi:eukaryotic-like serine/threonine-protein kinase